MNDNPNGMQAHLGLSTTGAANPLGTPTPHVRHPGEVSADVVSQTQSSSLMSMQTARLMQPPAMQGGGPWGDFGQQFQGNMHAIQAAQFNPYSANVMAHMTQMPGYNRHMIPSPIQMTDPSMGIFRPLPQGAAPMIPPVAQVPLFNTPLTPQPVSPMFQTPLDFNMAFGQQRGSQYSAAAMAVPGMGDRNPLARLAGRAAQFGGMSESFVIGGAGLELHGKGLSTPSSYQLGSQIESLAYSRQFRKETDQAFSAQDMTRMTHLAGDQGLLNMAQSPQQITETMRGLAKSLKVFMQIMNEPDIVEAMRQMGQMRTMGLTMPEIRQASTNARSYARMSGTSVQGVWDTGGLMGAMVAQQSGMSAGMGLSMGAGMYGMAHQAVAAGAYTPAQLARLGGVQGIAQRNMQNATAMLQVPMLTAATAQMNAGGTFGLDGAGVQGFLDGMDPFEMATRGTNNLMSAVQRGGVGALSMFQAQQTELQDQLGRVLGPDGMQAAMMRQVLQRQKMLGVQGPGGFVTGALSMGMDEDSAMQMLRQASSPEYYHNRFRHIQAQRIDMRMTGAEEDRRNVPSLSAHLQTHGGVLGSAAGVMADVSMAVGGTARLLGQDIGARISDWGMHRQLGREFRVERRSQALDAGSSWQQRQIDEAFTDPRQQLARDIFREKRDGRDYDGTLGMWRIGGVEAGRSSALYGLQQRMGGDTSTLRSYRRFQGGALDALGGGVGEQWFNLLTGRGQGTAEAAAEGVRDFEAGSNILYESLSASHDQMVSAAEALTESLGGDRGKSSALQSAFDTEIGAEARSNTHGRIARLWGRRARQLSESQIQAAGRRAYAEIGVTDATDEQLRALNPFVNNARTAAGVGAQHAFDPLDSTAGADARRRSESQTVDTMDDMVGLFFSGGGSSSGDRKARRDLFSRRLEMTRDPTEASQLLAYEALQAGGQAEKAEELLAALPQAQGLRIKRMAAELTKHQSGADRRLIGQMGHRAGNVGMGGADYAQTLEHGGMRVVLEGRGLAQVKTGLTRIFDSEFAEAHGGKAGHEILEAAITRAGGINKLAPDLQEYARQYTEAGSDAARAEAGDLFRRALAMDEGDTRTSGGVRRVDEVRLDRTVEQLRSVRGDVQQSFPAAVHAFADATIVFANAANRVWGAAQKTDLRNDTE